MGDKLSFEIRRSSTASPEKLFGLLSDATSWPSWFRAARNVSFEAGAVPPVRLVKVGPGLTVREVIVEETAPTHHAYSIQSLIPVKDHRADVRFTARPDGGTDIVWTSSMRAKVPGTGLAVKAVLSQAVAQLCAALVKGAEP
jgi:hypothetical protein